VKRKEKWQSKVDGQGKNGTRKFKNYMEEYACNESIEGNSGTMNKTILPTHHDFYKKIAFHIYLFIWLARQQVCQTCGRTSLTSFSLFGESSLWAIRLTMKRYLLYGSLRQYYHRLLS
jgi:hypothetical protein